jgi:hypothetical protein
MGVWKIKKKVFPKCSESLPFAKKDCNGKLFSTKKELKRLYLPIREDFTHLKTLKEELCTKVYK